MIRDITLGQFFPGNSVVHRLDPRNKIVLSCAYMVALFLASNAWGLLLSTVFMLFVVLLSQVPAKQVFRGLRPIIPIVVITALINAFYVPGDAVLRFYFVTVTRQGLELALFMSVRIIFLIVGTSMLTYTTSPITLTDGLEQLLSPLKKLRLPVHELSMMMTIALRFIPTLIEETDKIISAQKARGADFETGNFLRRIKALVPILVPLFVSAFRRAGELALAMDCRCYRGGEGRTRMRRLSLSCRDYLSILLFVLLFAGILFLNYSFRPMI